MGVCLTLWVKEALPLFSHTNSEKNHISLLHTHFEQNIFLFPLLHKAGSVSGQLHGSYQLAKWTKACSANFCDQSILKSWESERPRNISKIHFWVVSLWTIWPCPCKTKERTWAIKGLLFEFLCWWNIEFHIETAGQQLCGKTHFMPDKKWKILLPLLPILQVGWMHCVRIVSYRCWVWNTDVMWNSGSLEIQIGWFPNPKNTTGTKLQNISCLSHLTKRSENWE